MKLNINKWIKKYKARQYAELSKICSDEQVSCYECDFDECIFCSEFAQYLESIRTH